MTTAIKEIEKRLERKTLPLFAAARDERRGTMDENTPEGFVSRAETEELKRKLIALLGEIKAIVLSTDVKIAERLADSSRRFTKAEAQFAEDLWSDYQAKKQDTEHRRQNR
ncbi:MAG: hypothetical protein PHY02_06475 [Phycisphaerae bacterium]|nr:hypothetical protein [Phycisphaerae bacterium]